MDDQAFLADLRWDFPDLADEIDAPSVQGLFHLQVTAFARYVQEFIDAEAATEVRRCFAVADRATRDGDPMVQNAIGVAFLEHLNFQDGKVRREWAFSALPPNLRAAAVSLKIAPGYRRP